jgi:hypothetical protein
MTTQKQDFEHAAMLATSVDELNEALRLSVATPTEMIAEEFDRLEELVAALSLTTDEYCFTINWITGAGGTGGRGRSRRPVISRG